MKYILIIIVLFSCQQQKKQSLKIPEGVFVGAKIFEQTNKPNDSILLINGIGCSGITLKNPDTTLTIDTIPYNPTTVTEGDTISGSYREIDYSFSYISLQNNATELLRYTHDRKIIIKGDTMQVIRLLLDHLDSASANLRRQRIGNKIIGIYYKNGQVVKKSAFEHYTITGPGITKYPFLIEGKEVYVDSISYRQNNY